MVQKLKGTQCLGCFAVSWMFALDLWCVEPERFKRYEYIFFVTRWTRGTDVEGKSQQSLLTWCSVSRRGDPRVSELVSAAPWTHELHQTPKRTGGEKNGADSLPPEWHVTSRENRQLTFHSEANIRVAVRQPPRGEKQLRDGDSQLRHTWTDIQSHPDADGCSRSGGETPVPLLTLPNTPQAVLCAVICIHCGGPSRIQTPLNERDI